MKHNYILLLITICLAACGAKENSNIPYQINTPSHIYKMDEVLHELSGISFIDEENLACVQDEAGEIYIYNLTGESISKTIQFAGKGDFEDLVIAGQDAFALRSDGRIFKVNDYHEFNDSITEFETPLSKENDAEGMCYDSKSGNLLISCKGKSGEEDKDSRGIYSFDLKTNTLSDQPVITISLEQLKAFTSQESSSYLSKKFQKILLENNIRKVFVPSALAIHPVTNDVYLISAVNNLLLIVNRDGAIKGIAPLQHKDFLQPEGITFNNKGDLFISNEGKNKHANILRFNYEK
jgi:uncharacterized protein YjiK